MATSISTKLSEHDFSPAEYRLACLAKTKIRERISLENAWPDDNKDAFTWATLKQVVEDNDKMVKVFQKANDDDGLKERLITYVCHPYLSFYILILLTGLLHRWWATR